MRYSIVLYRCFRFECFVSESLLPGMFWKMEKKVLKDIQKHQLILPGNRVLVAVSGGADSMALLHFLLCQRENLKCTLGVVHLHHDIRGEAADEDADFVRRFCSAQKIPFYFKKENVPIVAEKERISLETAGRQARYRFFAEIIETEGYDLVATAHHRDDQAETLFMRLIRGTGLRGACGILPRTNQIIRPLLQVSKKEIERYCQRNGIAYRYDQTNGDVNLLRNRIRNQIMPLLSEINPQVLQHFADFSAKVSEAQQFLDEAVIQAEKKVFGSDSDHCEIALLDTVHPYLKKEILRRAIGRAGKTMTDIEQHHIEIILEQLSTSSTVWQLDIVHGIRVKRAYGQLFFEATSSDTKAFGCFDLPLNRPGTFTFGHFRFKIEFLLTKELISSEYRKKRCEIFLNCGKINKCVCIRSRRPGDYILLPGTQGHKKVKKLLIDRKISREKRAQLPMLAVGSEVLWIPGVAVDRRCLKPDPAYETTIKITMEHINEPGY